MDTPLTHTAPDTDGAVGAIPTTVDTVGVMDGIMMDGAAAVDGLMMADGVMVDTSLLAVTVDGVTVVDGVVVMVAADMSSPIQDTAADIAANLNGHRISLA